MFGCSDVRPVRMLFGSTLIQMMMKLSFATMNENSGPWLFTTMMDEYEAIANQQNDRH